MSRVISITESDELETVYDPCCESPHAYVSNGFVSHNCVAILDEIEKIFQTQSDSGVTSSLLSQLLWWLQEHKTRVFTVMTTNDLERIPAELHREGRIDATMEFLGVENVKDAQEFTREAFENMIKELGAEGDFKPLLASLKKQVELLYVDGEAVPQAKLTQVAYNMIKEGLSDA